MKNQQQARIHRFHDQVALSFDGTDQLYMTADMARKLATELRRFADNMKSNHWVTTRIVKHVSETPYPVGKARAYTESTGKSRVEVLP